MEMYGARFGVKSESAWGTFRVDSGSVQGRFGDYSGSIRRALHSGQIREGEIYMFMIYINPVLTNGPSL